MTPREAAELFGDRLLFVLVALVLTNLALMGMVGWFLFRHPNPAPIVCRRACVRTATQPGDDGFRWIIADDINLLTLYPDGSLEHERTQEGGEIARGRTLYPPLSVVHVEEA